MRLIIDADPIVYRCGFAAEDHSYQLVVIDCTKQMQQLHFSTGKDLKEWKKLHKETKEFETIEQSLMVSPGPKSHALKIVKTALTQCIKDVSQHTGVHADDLQASVLLSGQGNFRDNIATVKPYKGNRKEDYKPHWYQAIRNYMTDVWGARVISGREADDEVSIIARQCAQDGTDFVIATIDKDIDQVPGLHYDYVKKVFYDISPEEGVDLFWEQMLSGDSTDNIPGATRVGAVAAKRYVEEWSKLGKSPEERWRSVVDIYEGSKVQKGCLYVDNDSEVVALEMARLVFMQEYAGQLWTPPGVEDEMLEVQLDD